MVEILILLTISIALKPKQPKNVKDDYIKPQNENYVFDYRALNTWEKIRRDEEQKKLEKLKLKLEFRQLSQHHQSNVFAFQRNAITDLKLKLAFAEKEEEKRKNEDYFDYVNNLYSKRYNKKEKDAVEQLETFIAKLLLDYTSYSPGYSIKYIDLQKLFYKKAVLEKFPHALDCSKNDFNHFLEDFLINKKKIYIKNPEIPSIVDFIIQIQGKYSITKKPSFRFENIVFKSKITEVQNIDFSQIENNDWLSSNSQHFKDKSIRKLIRENLSNISF